MVIYRVQPDIRNVKFESNNGAVRQSQPLKIKQVRKCTRSVTIMTSLLCYRFQIPLTFNFVCGADKQGRSAEQTLI
jgi:hypothetical protein